MTSDSPALPVCFLCLETIQTREEATALDLELLSQKFLVFTENHLDIPSEKWALNGVGVQLEHAFCWECSSIISVLCRLYENLCDIQAKLAERMGELSNLLDGSKERGASMRSRKALLETLERQLGVGGNDGKMVEGIRDLLGNKCKLYSRKTLRQNSQTFISSEGCKDGDNSEAGDNDSVDMKIETSSINGSENDDDNDLQTDSKNSLNFDPNKMDEKDQDHSVTKSSPLYSDDGDYYGSSLEENDDDSKGNLQILSDSNNVDEMDQDYSASTSSASSSDGEGNDEKEDDDEDPDFRLRLEKETQNKTQNKRYSCDLCGKQFSNKNSITTHKKKMHGTIAPKPEKPFSCKLCPNKYGTRLSLISHISFKHRGHSILDKSFKCDICGRGSTTQHGVVLHKKKMHGIDLTTNEPTYDPKSFPCTFCPKSFSDRTSLRRHLKAKHKSSSSSSEISFPCKKCSLKFDTVPQRVNHIKSVHKDKGVKTPKTPSSSTDLPYTCSECPMTFDTQRQKTHHIYSVHKKNKKTGGFMKRLEGAMKTDTSDQTEQSCVVCSQEFKSWKLLHSHLKQKHEKVAANKKSHMCYFCNCLFCYEQSVWAHLKTCVTHNYTKIEFPCDHADHLGYSKWVFKDPTELESHFKEEHEDCEVIKCGDCGWPFLDKNMLEFHKLVHLPRIKYKYHCPTCSDQFLNTDTLQHHYNSVHGVALKLYRCEKCKTGFSGRGAIQLHFSWCLDDNEDDKQKTLEFLCSECPKRFETAYQLKTHVRSIHSTVQCTDCGVVLPRSKIYHHKVMKHAEAKFLCTMCGKAYKTRGMLQTHMSAHGQYRWICKYCGSGSRSSGHLKRHIGRMHKDKLAEEAAAKNISN